MKYRDENDFIKEFFERTVYNLKLYNKNNKSGNKNFKYEVTQLINSLLGLVVFVKEDDLSFNSINLDTIVKIEDINWRYDHRNSGECEDKNFSNFLRHIRNAISHKRLKIKSKDKQISSVVFKDEQRRNNNIFEVELNIEQINSLVKELSKCIEEQ